MKFELTPYKRNVSEEILIHDLKNVAQKLGCANLSRNQYDSHGQFCADIFVRRFGSWRNALQKAGLEVAKMQRERIDDEEYFKNLESVWRALGRQPVQGDIEKPLSIYSVAAYKKRFGNWRKALEAFVEYINRVESVEIKTTGAKTGKTNRTSRNISWRMRFLVMRRDNFKCKSCGRSPAGDPGIILHVDHIKAWANGGETILENLQTLCSVCNIGKSNTE